MQCTEYRATSIRWLSLAMLSAAAVACGGKSSSHSDSAAGGVAADTSSASTGGSGMTGMTMVRGTVATVSTDSVAIKTDTGVVHVALTQPVQLYDSQRSTLASVTPNSFIGVTSVKQPDGSEQATEIHVFPEALRGLGEGSHPMTQPGAASNSTMTNGSSTMTNGSMASGSASSGSTMSNGNVQGTPGSTMVVTYNGGSKTITVPPNTPVTAIVQISKPLAAGDSVIALATRGSNGALTANRVLMTKKP